MATSIFPPLILSRIDTLPRCSGSSLTTISRAPSAVVRICPGGVVSAVAVPDAAAPGAVSATPPWPVDVGMPARAETAAATCWLAGASRPADACWLADASWFMAVAAATLSGPGAAPS